MGNENQTKLDENGESEALTDRSTDRKDCPEITETRKKKFAIIGVSAGFTLILMFFLLATATVWKVRRNIYEDEEGRVCVPKDQFDGYDLHRACPEELESRDDTCCGTTSTVLSIFTKQLTLDTFTKHAATRLLSDDHCGEESTGHQQPVVVLLSGLDKGRTEAQGEGTLLFWNTTSERTILNNVRYENGNMQIPSKGYYYIYSQIVLKKQDVPDNNDHTHHMSMDSAHLEPYFSHCIYRTSSHTRPRKQRILESSNSACNIASQDNQWSITIGSVFELEADDWLCVETSHPQHIVGSHENNYFGMHSV